MARAAIPYGASCCRHPHRASWAACLWGWRTTSKSCVRSRKGKAWPGTTSPSIRLQRPTKFVAKWRRFSPLAQPDRLRRHAASSHPARRGIHLVKKGIESQEKFSLENLESDSLADGLMRRARSEEHTSELQSLMRISYAVFCLKKKNRKNI